MKNKLVSIAAAVLLLLGVSPAFAGGSDDPTPYEVTPVGITLPSGDVFEAHGHINIKYTFGSGGVAASSLNLHFDPNNNQPGTPFIGESGITWQDMFAAKGKTVPKNLCVTWVQIHGYNEHFGEGGQKPVCINQPPVEEPLVLPQGDYTATCDAVEVIIPEFEGDGATASWIANADLFDDNDGTPEFRESIVLANESLNFGDTKSVAVPEADYVAFDIRIDTKYDGKVRTKYGEPQFRCFDPSEEPPVEEPPVEEPPAEDPPAEDPVQDRPVKKPTPPSVVETARP